MSILAEMPAASARLVFDDVEAEIAPCVTEILVSIGAYEQVVCFMAECTLNDIEVAPAIAIQKLGFWKACGERLAETGTAFPDISDSDMTCLTAKYNSVRSRLSRIAV